MERCLQPLRKLFSLERGLTQGDTKPILWVWLKGSIVHGTWHAQGNGAGQWRSGPNPETSLESLTPMIQIFRLCYENPHMNKGNFCHLCNKYTGMDRAEICFVLGWLLPGKLSLQLLSNSNLHAPTPAPPRPCTVISSSTREDSQHRLTPYAISV